MHGVAFAYIGRYRNGQVAVASQSRGRGIEPFL
jgi:hypothetical protein